MNLTDWENHAKHRRYIAQTQKAWWGLAGPDGEPLMDLPAPLPDFEIPETHNATSAARVKFNILGRRGQIHPAVGALIDENIGTTDSEARLQPALRGVHFLVYEKHGVRLTYLIAAATLTGPYSAPNTLEIQAADMLTLVDGIPLWSYPRSLRGQWAELDRDYAAGWKEKRHLQNVQFAAQADGFVLSGDAEPTIRRAIVESLDATWKAIGRTDDPPVVVSTKTSGNPSPKVMIRPDDGFLWQTLAPIAAMAGTTINARMWWPGDPAVPGHNLTKPTIVIDVDQPKEG